MRTSYSKRELGASFGDSRLLDRFKEACEYFQLGLNQTIPEVCGTKSRLKAFYRLFNHINVTHEKMIAVHRAELEPILTGGVSRRLLQISDSTELDFTRKKGASQLGPLNYLRQRGMLLHNSLLLSDTGMPLGLLWQSYTVRKDEDFGKSKQREKLPIAFKETQRWIDHFEQGQSLVAANPQLEVVCVCDSEADLIELLQSRREERMHLVLRSRHNRLLAGGDFHLYERVGNQEVAGCYEARLTDHKTQKVRSATLEIRYCPVQLTQHRKVKSKPDRSVVDMFAIEAREVAPPADVDKPVKWVLLTTLPISSFEDAMQVVDYYLLRWLIERFHFLLKSGGAKVEKLQLQSEHRLKNAITTYSIAAFKALKIRYWAEKSPESSIYEAGVTKLEHEALYAYSHKKGNKSLIFDARKPPSIKQYCIVLGKIGGFVPSKRQPLPGFVILSRALHKLNTIVETYQLFCQRTE